MQGEWGLASWFPNRVKKVPKKGAASETAIDEEAPEAMDEEPEIDSAGEMQATA
jgi:hypothetical protein